MDGERERAGAPGQAPAYGEGGARPDQSWCSGCRHPLRGLPETEHECPECGRAFDLDDPRTYLSRLPSARRRLVKVVLAVLALGTLAYVLTPRGRITATVTLSTAQATVRYTRWRFDAPAWNPLRFAGWSSISGEPAAIGWKAQPVSAATSVQGGSWAWNGSASFGAGYPPRVLGEVFDDESASGLLDRLIREAPGRPASPPPPPRTPRPPPPG